MWYIVTPWKMKCLGRKLPKAVHKHGRAFTWNCYFMKYAVILFRPDWAKEDKARFVTNSQNPKNQEGKIVKISRYMEKLRDNFFTRLQRKTGWGKEEVKKEFNEASEQTILEMLEEND